MSPIASPLYRAADSGDPSEVRRLLRTGENPQIGDGKETPMHAAARRGFAEVVEALIEGDALDRQPDHEGRTPLDIARKHRTAGQAAVIALLDCGAISDPSFRAAVAALHAGDEVELARLIDAEPRLLHDRILGPEAYRTAKRSRYFRDPKLFWHVANNPTLMKRMPANVTEIARLMIERGIEQSDLDYTLGLVMTSSVAREQGHLEPLMRVLMQAGAEPTRDTVFITAAHCELGALRELLRSGYPMTAPIAAALGDDGALEPLLRTSDHDDVRAAFGFAVINRHRHAANLALDAGADVDAFLPVHAHSTALHQAAAFDDVPLIELLLSRGARTDILDTLWGSTAHGWALHNGRMAAAAALEAHAGEAT